MTTATIAIPDTLEQQDYEPTVADKIQRVLYRLDQGEPLMHGCLRFNDNFCVLGIFADESGIGHWGDNYRGSMAYLDSDDAQIDYGQIFDYYGLKDQFQVNDLPESVISKIIYKFGKDDTITLPYVNDQLYTNLDLNSILADMIRSGAIFK